MTIFPTENQHSNLNSDHVRFHSLSMVVSPFALSYCHFVSATYIPNK